MSEAVKVMLVGCGDVGSRLARRLLQAGSTVYGLRRQVEKLPSGVIPVAGDVHGAACPQDWPSGPLDYLVYCTAASQHDEEGYRLAYLEGLRHVLNWLRQHEQRPRRILFVSSSGVYAQMDGQWIDETAPALSQNYSGRIMLEAEGLLHASEFPATTVRLTGIYGPGREWLLKQVRMGYRVISEPPLYGNRIHADDAAGLLAFLIQADVDGVALEGCYIGVDDEPAPLHEVVGWLRQRLGVEHWAEESTVRRSGSKRCSNARARALGWRPEYPTYREGYGAVLRD